MRLPNDKQSTAPAHEGGSRGDLDAGGLSSTKERRTSHGLPADPTNHRGGFDISDGIDRTQRESIFGLDSIPMRGTSKSPGIVVTKELKAKLTAVRSHLELLADPLAAEEKLGGVEAVRDDNGQVIPGVLKYRATDDGPTAAILGGIHMSELSGVWALLKFHQRWCRGVRPERGSVIVATADVGRALEFIDLVLQSKSLSEKEWASFNVTVDHFNFNRIPHDILTTDIAGNHEQRAFLLAKHVLDPARGNVLDLHNTSVDAPPMVTLFMKNGETPEQSISRINRAGVANGLPIRNFIVWKPGPYNGMESIRSLGEVANGAVPILIETGASFDPRSFGRADHFAQLWLKNIMGMEPEETVVSDSSEEVSRAHYVETGAMYHPAVRPQDFAHLGRASLEEAQKDTFILIRDWPSLSRIEGWSPRAQRALKKLEHSRLSRERLNNFAQIKKGDIIAIGLETGLVLRAPYDCFVLMAGANPYIEPTFNETFINFAVRPDNGSSKE